MIILILVNVLKPSLANYYSSAWSYPNGNPFLILSLAPPPVRAQTPVMMTLKTGRRGKDYVKIFVFGIL